MELEDAIECVFSLPRSQNSEGTSFETLIDAIRDNLKTLQDEKNEGEKNE